MSLTKVSYSMITGAPVNVQDFGAKGDGVTDDTAAIQAAIIFCENNILPLYFPSNEVSQVYKTTAPLVVSKPLTMTGASSRNVIIAATGLTAGQFVLDIDGTAFGTYQNGKFGGFTLLAGAGNCMRIKNVSLSEFDDIGLRNCFEGIVYTGTRCFSNVFRRVEVVTGLAARTVQMTDHTGGGHHSFYDCTFGGSTGFAISTTTGTDSVNFYSCNFEQCVTNSFSCEGSVAGLGFYGCRTEGCDSTDFLIRPDDLFLNEVTGLVIEGCAFSASDSGGAPRIILGGATGKVRGFNISANSVGHGGNNFSSVLVQLNGDGESGTIANNYLDGQKALCAPTNVRRANVAIYNNEANDGKFDPQLTLEDGTWTPTDVSGAGLTFTSAAGRYTKIGRTVFWQALVVYPVTADGASAQFSLPPNLAPGGSTEGRAGAGGPVTDSVVVGALQFPTGIGLYKAGLIAATNADMSGKNIYIGGSYITLGV